MNEPSPNSRNPTLVAAFLLLLLFVTPVTRLWANPHMPWYLPYLLWAGVIGLMLLPRLFRRGKPDR
ncbi:MAG: hypothetical protein DSZ00_08960 [Gammaproteobacteria bacterium]|nr:MAG: hypothetical protein DSZ02_11220 [Gammaproteobacteria bacterium]RTZ72145.1 MAG: hypothetical protein DSZ00_08960 [Gammaproteobacteria bacterium]